VGLALGTAARFFAFRRFIFLHPDRVERRRATARAEAKIDAV
jgi:hypothetical protein